MNLRMMFKPDYEARISRVDYLTQEKNFYKSIAEECISQLLLTEDVRYSEERQGYYWVSNGDLVGGIK